MNHVWQIRRKKSALVRWIKGEKLDESADNLFRDRQYDEFMTRRLLPDGLEFH